MRQRLHDWKAIQEYHDMGHGFRACRKRFGVTHFLWKKAIAAGLLRVAPSPFEDRRRSYDWAAVQAYYDEGHSFRECQAHFGFANASWHKARLRGDIRARTSRMSIAQLLVGRRNRTHVKGRLIRAGLLENRCEVCGLTEWRGRPLSAHIDHINGVKNDNRLENLRMLCPNCHSQTETYGGRNLRRARSLQERGQTV